MKKILEATFLCLFLFQSTFAEERSEIEIKNGIFLEDVKAFGTFNEIDTAPLGMFKTKDNQFVQMSKYSQEKISEMVGKSRSHITNTLRLLKLPNKVLDMIKDDLGNLGISFDLYTSEKAIHDKGLLDKVLAIISPSP